MSLREQEYVIAIAKYGNISRAADSLFVSQPTLSIFLRKLEDSIGAPLFDRIGKQLIPTYAGQLYLNYAQELVFRNQQFQAELSSVISEHQGRIRVGIHKKRTLYLIPHILPLFRERYPNIEVSILEADSREMEELLLSNSLDLVICNRYFTSSQLQTINIYEDRLLMIARADHPAAALATPWPGQPYPYLDLNLVADETFILQHQSQSTRAFTDSALAYCNIKPQRRIQIENMDTASQLAAEGYGIAFTAKSYATYYFYHKPVQYFFVGDPNFYFNIFVAYNAVAHLPGYTKYFIDLVRDYFQTLP